MQNRKPPAYQEYAAAILTSLSFRKMTLQDRGLLYTMCLECWVNIRLPSNHDELAKVLGLPVEEVASSLDVVMPFFDLQDGFIICPELEDYRTQLADQKKKQSQGGKLGSAKTNSNRHTKTKDNGITSTSRLPRQGGDESLVQSSTVKLSQTQSIKKEVASIDDPWVKECEATEALEGDFSRISERLNNSDDS